jgi:hypothetical protein
LPRTRRPRRRSGIRRSTAWLIAVALAAIVLGSIALVARFDPSVFSRPPPPTAPGTPGNSTNYTIAITKIVYAPSACWANTTGPGTTVRSGTLFVANLALTNPTSTTCIVNVASATTHGFSIPGQNTPLSVPPGHAATLRLTIQTPNFEVHQALAISLTVQVL